GGQRHSVQLLVIFHRVLCNQHLVRVERNPHGFADAAGQFESGEEVNVVHKETNCLGLNRIVKFSGQAVRRGQLRKQTANIAAVVKASAVGLGLQLNRDRFGQPIG